MQVQLSKIELVEFSPKYQDAVENMVLPIQQKEFGVKITRDEQTDLIDIAGVFQKGYGNFWVALSEGEVVGTVGLVDIGNNRVALKKMFVRRDHRGKEFGVSATLMSQAKNWCALKGVREIYLGTVDFMKAAHRFYEKNGFVEVSMEQLPAEFPIVHVDTKFYKCQLG